ncbi:MAG TPA: hypothetical protein VF194_03400 [Ferrovibrio sp.]|uniref:hypothetical protein n=1 Tax=Ferrovibrio sp. TaxID=1917215 RepID=UPI002ED43785
MDFDQFVYALLPSLLLFFAVSLGANTLERFVRNYARNKFEIDRLALEAEAVRARMAELGGQYSQLNEEKAGLELKLQERQSAYGEALAKEIELNDPNNKVVYEIGVPRPRRSGWYVKVIGPEMHEMFSGPASLVSPFLGRRAARLIIWGKEDEEMARLRAKKVFGALSEILVLRRFDGKIRLSDA